MNALVNEPATSNQAHPNSGSGFRAPAPFWATAQLEFTTKLGQDLLLGKSEARDYCAAAGPGAHAQGLIYRAKRSAR